MRYKFKNSNFAKNIYYKKTSFNAELRKAMKAGYDIYVNHVRQLNNCLWARKLKGEVRLQEIFAKYWKSFKKEYAHLLKRKRLVS